MKKYIQHTYVKRGTRRLAGPDRHEGAKLLRQEQETLERFLFPLNLAYANPLPTVFLWRAKSLRELKAEAEWLVRDGLMPLLWFFQKYPRPGSDFKNRLLIHKEVSWAVPPAWRRHCGIYHYAPAVALTRARPKGKKAETVVTSFIASPLFCSQEFLARKLAAAKPSDVLAWAAVRDGLFLADSDLTASFRMTQTLLRAVSGEVRVRPWHELAGHSYYGDAAYLDLNQRLLCADDTPYHAFVSRGARVLSERRPSPALKKARRLPVSDYHDLVVERFQATAESLSPRRFLEQSYELLPGIRHSINQGLSAELPWPGWITEFGMWWANAR